MNKQEIIISGFGGQGVLLMGQLLAYTANEAGLSVSWLPAYGPEMRGGTANCMVVISEGRVNSPYIMKPSSLIAMNKPSLVRFEPSLTNGGLLVINTDMADEKSKRNDITIVNVAADSFADKLGSLKIANMVALGAFLGASGIFPLELAVKCLAEVIPDHLSSMRSLNAVALTCGYQAAIKG